MKTRHLKTALGAFVLAVGFASQATASQFTVASFANPSNGSANPLFTLNEAVGDGAFADATLAGGWSGSNLTLNFNYDSSSYANATFSMTGLTGTGVTDPGSGFAFAKTGGGTANITFKDASNNDILSIDFSRVWLNSLGAGSSSLLINANDVVNITRPGFPTIWTDPQTFAFAFANPLFDATGANPNTFNGVRTFGGTASWTASFDSSAETLPQVPEPGTLALLGTGLVALGARVRNRARKN